MSAPAATPAVPASATPVPPLSGSRVAVMSPRRFRLLMLAMFAAAAGMGAEGVQTLAEMRERHFTIMARNEAAAPVPYLTAMPALHALAPAADAEARPWVRADSAGPHAAALCALAASPGGGRVRWIALSPAVEPCVTLAAGNGIVQGSAAAGELQGARWIVLDAGGRALYARRDVPSPGHLRATVDLLAPARSGEPSR